MSDFKVGDKVRVVSISERTLRMTTPDNIEKKLGLIKTRECLVVHRVDHQGKEVRLLGKSITNKHSGWRFSPDDLVKYLRKLAVILR